MRIAVLLSAFLLVAPSLPAQQSPAPVRPAEIAVSAQGEAKAAPDRAVVTLGVQSRATTASDAARENARVQRAVLDTLRAMGFRSEQLSTANFNVRPEYAPAPDRSGPPGVTGYVVSNTVQATMHDTERVAQVVDAALAKGANTVHGLYFMLADAAPARREAIADAVAKARGDAEALARAAGGSLGRILELTTLPGPGELRTYSRAAYGGVAGGAITPVEPGQASVMAAVTVRWELVRGR
ncbi:MAG TPA: SIMPL domain-containing protein [Gemmatimonadaceae bacterium]|nr:SIMPL domain-containing protein [Gemmatimonadaceae bacterium]